MTDTVRKFVHSSLAHEDRQLFCPSHVHALAIEIVDVLREGLVWESALISIIIRAFEGGPGNLCKLIQGSPRRLVQRWSTREITLYCDGGYATRNSIG